MVDARLLLKRILRIARERALQDQAQPMLVGPVNVVVSQKKAPAETRAIPTKPGKEERACQL